MNLNFSSIKLHHKLLVAYSGGVDSHALLYHLAHSPFRQQLSAIHINHQLQTNAAAMALHCQQVCDQLHIPLIIKTITINKTHGDSLEAIAREARYQAIAAYVDTNTLVLTGQHADDQAETLLLQLLRGAGVQGLAAMPAVKPFATGKLLRPLLQTTRADILQYASSHDLKWVEDPSNLDTAYARNFLRHDILNNLLKRQPVAATTISRSAAHCAEAAEILAEVAAADLQALSDQAYRLHWQQLKTLSLPRQKNVLRYWLKQQAAIIASADQVQKILGLSMAEKKSVPVIELGQWRIGCYREHYYLWQYQAPIDYEFTWDLQTALQIPGFGPLSPRLDLVPFSGQRICVRNRRPGDKVLVAEKQFHKRLKHVFQERGIPPWLRSQWPLVVVEGEVVAVV